MKRAGSENRKTAALWLLAAACLMLSPLTAEAGKKVKSKWAKKEPKASVQPAKPKPQADMSASAGSASAGSASAGSASAGVVNVNKATIPELCLLPGIGPKRAGQIVALRSKKPFKSPKELPEDPGPEEKPRQQ